MSEFVHADDVFSTFGINDSASSLLDAEAAPDQTPIPAAQTSREESFEAKMAHHTLHFRDMTLLSEQLYAYSARQPELALDFSRPFNRNVYGLLRGSLSPSDAQSLSLEVLQERRLSNVYFDRTKHSIRVLAAHGDIDREAARASITNLEEQEVASIAKGMQERSILSSSLYIGKLLTNHAATMLVDKLSDIAKASSFYVSPIDHRTFGRLLCNLMPLSNTDRTYLLTEFDTQSLGWLLRALTKHGNIARVDRLW